MKSRTYLFGPLIGALALVVLSVAAVYAAVPWPSGASIPSNVQNVTGSTPSPAAFPTSTNVPGVIIDLMTGNTTMGALTGGITGNYETLIIEQDGSGSRTFTGPSTLKGMPSTIPTAANSYTVCKLYYDGTNYNVTPTGVCFDNLPLTNLYANVQSSAGTAIAPNATQAQTTLSVPGANANTPCSCTPQTYPATWQVGIATQCVPGTNTVICQVVNGDPTNTHTPTAISLSVRLYP